MRNPTTVGRLRSCVLVRLGRRVFWTSVPADAERRGEPRCDEVRRLCSLQHPHQATLRIRVAVDITLGVLDRSVSGELLYVAQTTTGFGNEPRGIGDEGASPRVLTGPRLVVRLEC
jgi:hypothetical protein